MMAMNYKELLVDTLLVLIEGKPLSSITVQQLLNQTGISRQTFYNHFKDKNDLIHYVYTSRVVKDFNGNFDSFDFYDALLDALKQMKIYHKFMKQACLLDDQNCLKDFIFDHCLEFDQAWHQYLYGDELMSEELRLATQYHSLASSSMTLSWILTDCSIECEQMVDMIVKMRSLGMDILFEDYNPYIK